MNKYYWLGKHRTEETKRKISLANSGKNNFMYGKHHSKETKIKISIACQGRPSVMKDKKHSKESKKKISKALKKYFYSHSHSMKGKYCSKEIRKNMSIARKKYLKSHPQIREKNSNWKGGITKLEGYRSRWYKEWISNPKNKLYKRTYNKKRKLLTKDLSLSNVQRVYENNIKEFGTLTCIYCLQPILFGKDTLEHIIPLSRGGTNEYDNLAVTCIGCNCSKRHNTLKEWFEKGVLKNDIRTT